MSSPTYFYKIEKTPQDQGMYNFGGTFGSSESVRVAFGKPLADGILSWNSEARPRKAVIVVLPDPAARTIPDGPAVVLPAAVFVTVILVTAGLGTSGRAGVQYSDFPSPPKRAWTTWAGNTRGCAVPALSRTNPRSKRGSRRCGVAVVSMYSLTH